MENARTVQPMPCLHIPCLSSTDQNNQHVHDDSSAKEPSSAGATAVQQSGHAAAAYEARQWKEIAETHVRKHTINEHYICYYSKGW